MFRITRKDPSFHSISRSNPKGSANSDGKNSAPELLCLIFIAICRSLVTAAVMGGELIFRSLAGTAISRRSELRGTSHKSGCHVSGPAGWVAYAASELMMLTSEAFLLIQACIAG